jgi:hypothetical protein
MISLIILHALLITFSKNACCRSLSLSNATFEHPSLQYRRPGMYVGDFPNKSPQMTQKLAGGGGGETVKKEHPFHYANRIDIP